jgi:hypothetical protein
LLAQRRRGDLVVPVPVDNWWSSGGVMLLEAIETELQDRFQHLFLPIILPILLEHNCQFDEHHGDLFGE